MRDDTMTVEVPAKLLNQVLSLSKGYTMSRGDFIPKAKVERELSEILWDAGYEYWQDNKLF